LHLLMHADASGLGHAHTHTHTCVTTPRWWSPNDAAPEPATSTEPAASRVMYTSSAVSPLILELLRAGSVGVAAGRLRAGVRPAGLVALRDAPGREGVAEWCEGCLRKHGTWGCVAEWQSGRCMRCVSSVGVAEWMKVSVSMGLFMGVAVQR